MSTMRWEKHEIDKNLVKVLNERFNLDLLVAAIFARRNIQSNDDIKYYLESDLMYQHNPFLFAEMEDVVDRILLAKSEGEKVMIFGDRDVDGISATVLLYSKLKEWGIDVSWALPQGDDPYGLTKAAVSEFADNDGTLLITVDCGISNHEEIAYANDKGIDTIITDHHLPSEELPAAYALLNPKIEDSGYPFQHLSGCGVVAKLIWALEFSETELYNHTVCLVNVRPGNDTLILEAVKLLNLVEVDRIEEQFVPGVTAMDKSRLYSFFQGHELLAYDAATQTKMMQKAFGPSVDIHLIDLTQEIVRIFPKLNGMSLLKLRENSRMLRYADETPGELDVLIELFSSYVYKRFENLGEGYKKNLDLVALSTLADLMPLKDENRILVKLGMHRINTQPRPSLKVLIDRQNLSGATIGTTEIGWQITPLINATGRLGVPDIAAKLFLAEDPQEQYDLSNKIVGINNDRKKLGEAAWKNLLPKAKKSFEEFAGKLVLVADTSLNRGITGIMSNRMVQYFQVPSIIVSILGDRCVGSMRSANGFNVKDFLDNFAEFFIDYGGHDYAAGFSLDYENKEAWLTELTAFVKGMKEAQAIEEVLTIDAELPLKYMSPQLNDLVEIFEPYGEENPPLKFLARSVLLDQADIVGKSEPRHLKMLINSGSVKWPAVYWGAAERIGQDFATGERVDIVFRLARNYFQNKETLQLTILDMKRSN